MAGPTAEEAVITNRDIDAPLVAVAVAVGYWWLDLAAAAVIAQTTRPDAVHDVVEVDRWIYGSYQGHVAGYLFNNFPIEPDRAYFLRADRAFGYRPSPP